MSDEKINVQISVVSNKHVKDAIILIPDDEYHPLTQAFMKDAVKIDIDFDKLGKLKVRGEDD